MVRNIFLSLSGAFLISTGTANAQNLSLKEAVQTALTNYGTIRAKANYVKASQATVKETRREYLPDLILSAQQDYGTVDANNGPYYGYKGGAVASSGPVLGSQNWNAAWTVRSRVGRRPKAFWQP